MKRKIVRPRPSAAENATPQRLAFRPGAPHICRYAANLSPEEYAAIAGILRDMVAADRFPLSPRVRGWRAILEKLEPPKPRPAPLPPLKTPGEPSMVVARMRGTKRRR